MSEVILSEVTRENDISKYFIPLEDLLMSWVTGVAEHAQSAAQLAAAVWIG